MNNSKDSKDLLGFFFTCSDSMQSYWNYYLTVSIGLVAFFGSVKPGSLLLISTVTVAFILFALVNLLGICNVNNLRKIAAIQIKKNALNEEDELARLYANKLRPPKNSHVIIFHIIVDISTIIIIWLLFPGK